MDIVSVHTLVLFGALVVAFTALLQVHIGHRLAGSYTGLEGTNGTAVISPVAGLDIGFLKMLPSRDQVHIFDLSIRASRTLHHWAARYPLIRRERVWPLALSVAAAAPFCSVEALIATARLSLWVFTLDDLFDDERVLMVELRRRAARYRAIARDQPADEAEDSLAQALREVRDDLTHYSLFSSLGEAWTTALCGTIDAMMREHQWRNAYQRSGAAALPGYTDYVTNGIYSIGGPPHVWASLITVDDPSTIQRLSQLRAMERAACICIRLANDLQSFDKEVREGKINALVLLSQQAIGSGFSLAEAHALATARVRAEITESLNELAILRDTARTETGRPEAAIADIARFVCDFYVHHDYHTVGTQLRQTPSRELRAVAAKRGQIGATL